MARNSENKPRLLNCIKDGSRMSSLAYSPKEGGLTAVVSAHEGPKPVTGDYLALGTPDKPRLYRVVKHDHCYNVDPANMWIAHVEFVPGSTIKTLKDVPETYYEERK